MANLFGDSITRFFDALANSFTPRELEEELARIQYIQHMPIRIRPDTGPVHYSVGCRNHKRWKKLRASGRR